MSKTVSLRRWQAEGLQRLEKQRPANFLAVATPGAGKTMFALVSVVRMLAEDRTRRLVVVAPTAHLKTQWADDARERFGLRLLDNWDATSLPPDVHGVTTTYQAVASNPQAFARVAYNGVVVFDEVHHAGAEKAWGDALLLAFGGAARRLSLTGTPFRSDRNPIPFVYYDQDGLSQSDVVYGYSDGLKDKVVRPVKFKIVSGEAEWVSNDGERMSASLEESLDKKGTSQRLRTAVSAHGSWLKEVLAEADQELTMYRRSGHPDCGALVLAVDHQHAHDIAGILSRITGEQPMVILSDDPQASKKISTFSAGRSRWLVAVRMVSEGVDVPRLRVGVWATTTSTELFFRQAVGRLVRTSHGPYGPSTMFLPRDPRLVECATAMSEERRHDISMSIQNDADVADRERTQPGQMFEALGATRGEGLTYSTERRDVPEAAPAADAPSAAGAGAMDVEVPELPPLVVEETAAHRKEREKVDRQRAAASERLPSLAPRLSASPSGQGKSHRELRAENQKIVKTIGAVTGQSERAINSELNRFVSVASVADATVEQLARRLAAARDWLGRAQSRNNNATW